MGSRPLSRRSERSESVVEVGLAVEGVPSRRMEGRRVWFGVSSRVDFRVWTRVSFGQTTGLATLIFA